MTREEPQGSTLANIAAALAVLGALGCLYLPILLR